MRCFLESALALSLLLRCCLLLERSKHVSKSEVFSLTFCTIKKKKKKKKKKNKEDVFLLLFLLLDSLWMFALTHEQEAKE
jgi:hypothetical protein